MGTLTPRNREIELHRRMFNEKVKLVGISGLFYPVQDYNQSIKKDYDRIIYGEPREISFIFDGMPSIRTLRAFNWYVEDEEILPCLAFIPWYYEDEPLQVTEGSILELIDPISKEGRKFLISQVNANAYYMINYVVKLVPIRDQYEITGKPIDSEEEDDSGYDYLHI